MQASNDLRRYIPLMLHWAWLLALAAILSGTVAYLISIRQTPIYQASTTISIQEAPGTNASAELQSIMLSQQRIQTYAQLMKARPLLEAVSKQLGWPQAIDPDTITVAPVRDTQLIRVSVNDVDPARAAQTANTLVSVFAAQRQAIQSSRYAASKESLQQQLTVLGKQVEQTSAALEALGDDTDQNGARDRLQTSLTQYQQSYANLLQSFEQVRLAEAATTSNVVLEEPAIAPTLAISPRVKRNTALAAMMGLLLAAGLVVLRENLDDKVKDPDALSELVGLPVLGLIARTRRGADASGPIVIAEPRSPLTEAYRALRTNIEFASVDQPIRTILITSPSPDDGKSTVAVNLAAVLAQGQRNVVVVDADLRRPTVHKRLDLTNRSGLSELFVQADARMADALRPTRQDSLQVLAAGLLPPNPAELLGSHKMEEILGEIRAHVDMVVIDTPPVTVVTDAVVLAPRVDGVLLVVRAGATRLGSAQLAVEQLRRVGANIIGIVVNDIPLGRAGYGYAYQGYYKYYREDGEDTRGNIFRRVLRRRSKPAPEVTEKA